MVSLLVIAALIVPVLCVLCVKDARHRTLPNAWTLALALECVALRLAFGGLGGLLDGILGGLVCGAFILLPYLMSGAGGGDVKMMFGAGIATGLRLCVAEMLFVSVSGLLLGLGMLVVGKVAFRRKGRKDDEAHRIPFGVAIAVGTECALLFAWALEAWK